MTAEKNGTTHHGPVFGDHATFIVGDANGVGGRNAPAPVPRAGRWERPGKAVVGVATVVGTVVTVVAFWVTLKGQDSPKGDRAEAVAPPVTTATHQPASAPADDGVPVAKTAGTVFSDVVTAEFGIGYDLDSGKARKQYRPDADTDMTVTSYSLAPSARHSAMYSDTSAGDESGAYDRCRTYRLSGRTSTPTALIYPAAQYCFTSSDNHPGWFQVVSQVGNAFMIKVVIWSE